MPTRQTASRVCGPTWIESRQRWRLLIVKEGTSEKDRESVTRWFRPEEKQLALDTKEELEAGFARLSKTTVDEALTMYQEHLDTVGTSRVSYKETLRRLRLFFPDLQAPISRVTPERGKRFYESFRQRKKPNGDDISVAYHRATLINARSFLSWCVEQGWLVENPLANVKGVGRRNAGKVQHTGDETRKLYAYCLERARVGDEAALGVLMALLMALRSSDITRRVVRDVDLDATVLRVDRGKTEKSNRPRKVPAVLQPMLRRLAAGRIPFEPLFKTPYTDSGFHTRRWLEEAMVRFCEAAEVLYVCPHALKGTAATLLAETGAAAEVIADHLSHEETSTTKKHYVAPGAAEAAQLERAFAVIAGGKR
jgi:integrase